VSEGARRIAAKKRNNSSGHIARLCDFAGAFILDAGVQRLASLLLLIIELRRNGLLWSPMID